MKPINQLSINIKIKKYYLRCQKDPDFAFKRKDQLIDIAVEFLASINKWKSIETTW